MRLNHVALVCSSEENANEFYVGILGLERMRTSVLPEELSREIFNIGGEYQVLVYGNDRFTAEVFIAANLPRGESRFEHVCLEVEDVETFVTECESRQVRVNRVFKGDRLLTFVEDFDGNLFEIKEIAK
ncbi:MAG: VOC family protein [Deltaproteobacteria bacterium]|nr:VOC family protein [Deltaproteobacteria bacterium]